MWRKGLGDALASARHQLHCHLTATRSDTACKSYSSPSGAGHSLCSQAREALKKIIFKKSPQKISKEATQQHQNAEQEASSSDLPTHCVETDKQGSPLPS